MCDVNYCWFGVFVIYIIVRIMMLCVCLFFFFFFKQKTAYEMRISDLSSDVCSSDLAAAAIEAAKPATASTSIAVAAPSLLTGPSCTRVLSYSRCKDGLPNGKKLLSGKPRP